MIKIIPTFSTGIALTPFDSKYPHLWNGLVGMWCPSAGKQGGSLFDLSLYNRPGTLNNMDSGDYIGSVNGYALNYDGINDFTHIGNIPEINDASQDISIIQYVRTTGASSNCLWYYDNNDSLSPSTDAYLITPSNLQIGGIGQGGQISTGISVNDGLWHQIAVVLKGTTIFLYKDGVPVFSTSVAHNHGNYATSLNFRLGDNANVAFFGGDIGDTLLYNRALETSEIIEIVTGQTALVPQFFSTGKTFIIGDTPEPLDAVANIETPTIIIDADISVSPLDAVASIEAPTVGEILSITPNPLDANATLETPTVIIDMTVTPNPLDASASIESPIFPVIGSLIAKIISINPLIAVTDTSPVQIIKIDTTDPDNLTYVSNTIPNINNAKDVNVDSSGDFVYVGGSDGKVVKVEIADLTNQTTFDLSDTDDILTIEHNTNFGITYAGTDNDTGELYTLDERSTFKLDSDFTCLSPQEFKLNSDFNIVSAFKLDSDFTALSYQTFKISSDFKCLTKETVPITPPSPSNPLAPIDDIIPIDLEDFQVFVDSVELENSDLILDSIFITHSIGEESSASFRLSRKHDQLDTTLEGISSVITNQNNVVIKIKGITEFSGKISELDCQYQNNTEYVIVNALATEKENVLNKITMSLPGIDSRLSIYDILIQNPKIFNPYIDPDNEDNPKKYKGIRVNLGTIIKQSITKLTIFNGQGNVASKIQDGTFNPLPNWTYFWSPLATNFGDVPLGSARSKKFFYIGTSLAPVSEDLWILQNAPHHRQRIYDDIEIKLGDGTVSVSDFDGVVTDPTNVHIQLQTKGYLLGGAGVITNKFKKSKDSSELRLTGVTTNEQIEVYEIIEKALGYTVGEAPFQDISVRNGIKITKPKLVDEPDRLSSIKDASYNFVEYAKRVADLEYEKLKNINGNILPDTSCAFNLTVDGYFYYNISLLTQINIDNTTESNIYNNINGFPVSAKSITITSSDRKVTINADNKKSNEELEIINSQFPNESDNEYNEEGQRVLIAIKSNMRTGLDTE